MMTPVLRSGFIRASRKNPCAICGRTSWPCEQFKDGRGWLCGKVPSDKPTRDGTAWLHFNQDIASARNFDVPLPKSAPKLRATPNRLHTAYSALLDRLTLRPEHRHDLHVRRGLPLSEIERLSYKSTPNRDEAQEIVREISSLGLSSVPGFYFRDEWRMVGMLPGCIIPYRGISGRILGLSYRLDTPLDKAKYLWLSSPPDATHDDGRVKFPRGTKLDVPLHYAGRHLFASAQEIWITEGGLKADIASHLLGVPFIAAGGVTQFGADFGEVCKTAFPRVSRFIIAFDRDWRMNPQVKRALEKLMRQLSAARVPYVVRTWPGEEKGIDNYALAQSHVKGVAA